jgi:O-antigen ligase
MKGLLFLLPLLLVVALVYEATHEEKMSLIFRKGLKLFVMLAGGIILLAAVVMIIGRYF